MFFNLKNISLNKAFFFENGPTTKVDDFPYDVLLSSRDWVAK